MAWVGIWLVSAFDSTGHAEVAGHSRLVSDRKNRPNKHRDIRWSKRGFMALLVLPDQTMARTGMKAGFISFPSLGADRQTTI